MKYSFIALSLFTLLSCFSNTMKAQPQPRLPTQLPKHELGKPVTTAKAFSDVVGKWKGTRLTQNSGSVTVDSLFFEFKKDGTVHFRHQRFEHNPAKTGTYSFIKNVLIADIYLFPFKHRFEGTYDRTTGKITGTFSEVREKDPNAPPYYVPGTESGSFSITK
jgi:hypothetical protein